MYIKEDDKQKAMHSQKNNNYHAGYLIAKHNKLHTLKVICNVIKVIKYLCVIILNPIMTGFLLQ